MIPINYYNIIFEMNINNNNKLYCFVLLLNVSMYHLIK